MQNGQPNETTIEISSYESFLDDLIVASKDRFLDENGYPDLERIRAAHRAFCAGCGSQFTTEALTMLYLHLSTSGSGGQMRVVGATEQGERWRGGTCPECGHSRMRVVVDPGVPLPSAGTTPVMRAAPVRSPATDAVRPAPSPAELPPALAALSEATDGGLGTSFVVGAHRLISGLDGQRDRSSDEPEGGQRRCDICGKPVGRADAHLLAGSMILDSPAYQNRFGRELRSRGKTGLTLLAHEDMDERRLEALVRATQTGGDLETSMQSAALNIAARNKAWLVCPDCLFDFSISGETAKRARDQAARLWRGQRAKGVEERSRHQSHTRIVPAVVLVAVLLAAAGAWLYLSSNGFLVPRLGRLVVDPATASFRREAAIIRLANLGPKAKEAVPQLVKALSDRTVAVRETAATALGRIRDRRAVGPLVLVLENDSRYTSRLRNPRNTSRFALSSVRAAAALALGRIGDRRAVPFLERARDDPDHRIKSSARRALRLIESRQR